MNSRPKPNVQRIAALDIAIFDAITCEMTSSDKRSQLAIQNLVAEVKGSYRYLEIGSHLGGSIQPHLLDERCVQIYSVDPRPAKQPDERGNNFAYVDNSTARMMAGLSAIAQDEMSKIRTFETDAVALANSNAVLDPVDLVFIDGEHSDRAAEADFNAAMRFSSPDCLIVFHDAPIVYGGIANVMRALKKSGRAHFTLPLPDSLFAVFVGSGWETAHAALMPLFAQSGDAYLKALMLNGGYRRFYRLPPFSIIRSLLSKLKLSRNGPAYGYGTDPWDLGNE